MENLKETNHFIYRKLHRRIPNKLIELALY